MKIRDVLKEQNLDERNLVISPDMTINVKKLWQYINRNLVDLASLAIMEKEASNQPYVEERLSNLLKTPDGRPVTIAFDGRSSIDFKNNVLYVPIEMMYKYRHMIPGTEFVKEVLALISPQQGVAEGWSDYDDNQYSLTDSTGKELTLLRGNTPEEAIERAKQLIGSNEKLLATFGLVKLTPRPHYIVRNAKRQGVAENFADGKVKGKSRPGRVKRAGASCSGSVSDLRARAKKYGGERGKMYHWCANMKGGRKKAAE